MSSSMTMMGTPIKVAKATWHAQAPATLPIMLAVMVPTVSAAPIPCMLVAADGEGAQLQALVPAGTVFPVGTKLEMLDGRLEAVGTGVVE